MAHGFGKPFHGNYNMSIGFDKPLYILLFDHRATFQSKMFVWKGRLNSARNEETTAAKGVIYDGFKTALAAGVAKEKAGVLVDEQFANDIMHMPA
jgi:5-dehydro-2-deoxygluconokinase